MKQLKYIAFVILFATVMFYTQPIEEAEAPKIPLLSTQIATHSKKVISVHKKRTAPAVSLASLYQEPTGEALEIASYIAASSGVPIATIKKIMWAESQYLPTAKGINKNGSFDTGYMQINSQHIPLAKSMGLDVFTPKGNADFAIYLIKKNGLSDWGFSKSTWSAI